MPRQQCWHNPAEAQVSEEQPRGPTGHPNVHTQTLNLGVPALLRMTCIGHVSHEDLSRSLPAEGSRRPCSTGELWAGGDAGRDAGTPWREPREEKDNRSLSQGR